MAGFRKRKSGQTPLYSVPLVRMDVRLRERPSAIARLPDEIHEWRAGNAQPQIILPGCERRFHLSKEDDLTRSLHVDEIAKLCLFCLPSQPAIAET